MKTTTTTATGQAQVDWTASPKSATRQEKDEIFALVMSASHHKSQAAHFENAAKVLKQKILRRAGK